MRIKVFLLLLFLGIINKSHTQFFLNEIEHNMLYDSIKLKENAVKQIDVEYYCNVDSQLVPVKYFDKLSIDSLGRIQKESSIAFEKIKSEVNYYYENKRLLKRDVRGVSEHNVYVYQFKKMLDQEFEYKSDDTTQALYTSQYFYNNKLQPIEINKFNRDKLMTQWTFKYSNSADTIFEIEKQIGINNYSKYTYIFGSNKKISTIYINSYSKEYLYDSDGNLMLEKSNYKEKKLNTTRKFEYDKNMLLISIATYDYNNKMIAMSKVKYSFW